MAVTRVRMSRARSSRGLDAASRRSRTVSEVASISSRSTLRRVRAVRSKLLRSAAVRSGSSRRASHSAMASRMSARVRCSECPGLYVPSSFICISVFQHPRNLGCNRPEPGQFVPEIRRDFLLPGCEVCGEFGMCVLERAQGRDAAVADRREFIRAAEQFHIPAVTIHRDRLTPQLQCLKICRVIVPKTLLLVTDQSVHPVTSEDVHQRVAAGGHQRISRHHDIPDCRPLHGLHHFLRHICQYPSCHPGISDRDILISCIQAVVAVQHRIHPAAYPPYLRSYSRPSCFGTYTVQGSYIAVEDIHIAGGLTHQGLVIHRCLGQRSHFLITGGTGREGGGIVEPAFQTKFRHLFEEYGRRARDSIAAESQLPYGFYLSLGQRRATGRNGYGQQT